MYSVTMITAALATQQGSQCLCQYCHCSRRVKSRPQEFRPLTRWNLTHSLPMMLQSIDDSYVRSAQKEHFITQPMRWIQTNQLRYACSD